MAEEQSAHSDAVQTNMMHRDVKSRDLSGQIQEEPESVRRIENGRADNFRLENGRRGAIHPPPPQTIDAVRPEAGKSDAGKSADYSFIEVANLLNVSPDTLRRLSLRFADYLGEGACADEATYSRADVAALSSVQKLLAQGYDDEQIGDFLTIPGAPAGEVEPSLHSIVAYPAERRSREAEGSTASKTVNEILATISGSQQAVLNSQSTVREVVGVLVQDNFNLKDENRKLRERMLEVERSLAEYQRREEARKERLDGRLRALEGTMAALQQQVAQLVQLQRQQRKRRGWFG